MRKEDNIKTPEEAFNTGMSIHNEKGHKGSYYTCTKRSCINYRALASKLANQQGSKL